MRAKKEVANDVVQKAVRARQQADENNVQQEHIDAEGRLASAIDERVEADRREIAQREEVQQREQMCVRQPDNDVEEQEAVV